MGVETTLLKIATGAQLIGGVILVIAIILTGIKMSAGGEEGLRSGKKGLIGIVVGAVLIFGATGIKEWLKSNLTTGSLPVLKAVIENNVSCIINKIF